jgi:hypothetical protein
MYAWSGAFRSPGRDTARYVCVTREDGHRAWSSRIYVIPRR